MAKNKINIGGDAKGNVKIGNQKDIKNSELTESDNALDIKGSFEGDLEVDNKEGFDGVKSKKTIVYIIIAITTALATIAGYYYKQQTKEPTNYEEPTLPTASDDIDLTSTTI